MIAETVVDARPIETVLRALKIGIKMRVDDEGEIKLTLPDGLEVPSWLREAKARDAEGLAFAVAMVAAVGRGGGDPAALLSVHTLQIEAVQ